MKGIVRDLRFGFRLVGRDPWFALLSVLVLALGVGSTTAVFSVVNAVLLRPLPYDEPQQLVIIWDNFWRLGMERLGVKAAEYVDYRGQNSVFEDTAAFTSCDLNISGEAHPERIAASRVTVNMFGLLGSKAAIGRVFESRDERPGSENVAILSDGLWKRRYGADPEIVGKVVTLNDQPHTIVGVMPSSFEFPHRSFWFASDAELWTPLSFTPDEISTRRGPFSLRVLARLKRGSTLEEARADMDAIATRLDDQFRDNRGPGGADGGWKITVFPLHAEAASTNRPTLMIIFAAAVFLLLIACTNVAGFLLARATARRREMAVRLALGATRRRLLQQLLTESLMFALAGGAVGLLFAQWGVDFINWSNPANIAQTAELAIDQRVVLFTLIISLTTWVLFGLTPALESSGSDVSEALKATSHPALGGGGLRFRSLLVLSEIAFSSLLLVGAILSARSLMQLERVNPGLNSHGVLTAEVSLPETRYADDARVRAFYDRVEQTVRGLPGRPSVGITSILPLNGSALDDPFSIEGRPFDPAVMTVAGRQSVSAGYFQTMQVNLLQGRDFTPEDTASSPRVAVINSKMADTYWPNENPLGKRIKLGAPGTSRPWLTIVGIVSDIPHRRLDVGAKPEWYAPAAQEPPRNAYLVVRAPADAANLEGALSSAVLEADADQPLGRVAMMDEVVEASFAKPKFTATLLGVFGAIALILAAIGIYGLISYSVTQRTAEIGVRVALGARPGDVVMMIVRHGVILALAGTTIGLVAAFLLSRMATGLLWQVSAADPPTFLFVGVVSMMMAGLASYLPARRAARLDPTIALRTE